MLTAYNEHRELIVLTRKNSRQMLIRAKKEKYYCPACKEAVILKVGIWKTPHFAHKRHSLCTQQFSEGESLLHLLGKQKLYDFFQQKGLSVQLERYVATINQRPDLYVDSTAIEYQCSPISFEQIQNRTAGYMQANIAVQWLLKPITVSKTNTIQLAKIPRFMQHFIVKQSLLTFSPEQNKFIYIGYPLFVSKLKAIVKVVPIPMEDQQFPFLKLKQPTNDQFEMYAKIYIQQRQQQIINFYKYNRSGVQNPFLKACYEVQIPLTQIPLFIGLPYLNDPDVLIWQMQWFAFLKRQQKTIQTAQKSDFLLFCSLYPQVRKDSLISYVQALRQFHINTLAEQITFEQLKWHIASQFLA